MGWRIYFLYITFKPCSVAPYCHCFQLAVASRNGPRHQIFSAIFLAAENFFDGSILSVVLWYLISWAPTTSRSPSSQSIAVSEWTQASSGCAFVGSTRQPAWWRARHRLRALNFSRSCYSYCLFILYYNIIIFKIGTRSHKKFNYCYPICTLFNIIS